MSSIDTEKLGADQVAAVTARASKIASALANENDTLRAQLAEAAAKIASFERNERVRKIASAMEEKGLNADMTFDEKVASISNYDSLDQVEEAIKMAGAGSIHLPEVVDEVPGRTADPQVAFHSYLVHGQD
jgi:hypothetical protein